MFQYYTHIIIVHVDNLQQIMNKYLVTIYPKAFFVIVNWTGTYIEFSVRHDVATNCLMVVNAVAEM
jgi:hypothetical protein